MKNALVLTCRLFMPCLIRLHAQWTAYSPGNVANHFVISFAPVSENVAWGIPCTHFRPR